MANISEVGLTNELLTGFKRNDAGTTGNSYQDILRITSFRLLKKDTILLEQNNYSLSLIDSKSMDWSKVKDTRGKFIM